MGCYRDEGQLCRDWEASEIGVHVTFPKNQYRVMLFKKEKDKTAGG